MNKKDLARFIPEFIGDTNSKVWGGFVASDDLFGSVAPAVLQLFNDRHEGGSPNASSGLPIAAFAINGQMALTFDHASIRPSLAQCLVGAIAKITRDREIGGNATALVPTMLDPKSAVMLWARASDDRVPLVVRYWSELSKAETLDPLEVLTTPKLYGNKIRLAAFIGGIASAVLPAEMPVLDLMAGTGIVARSLAQRHPIFVNDANPYAALLARSQGVTFIQPWAPAIIENLKECISTNLRSLTGEIGTALETEAQFFHADVDQDAFDRYTNFVGKPVLPIRNWPATSRPYRLCVERYSNVYFGVLQSAELDSIRFAIDQVSENGSAERDLCLAALIIAASNCTTGPHFAQPRSIRSVRAMRQIVERRSRSITWEFELALVRLAGRRQLNHRIIGSNNFDWRQAILNFRHDLADEAGAVYIDPPYSKLQYSRYYHVLNVLLAYDYPSVEGSGRYPPRSQRFSSRFEYQPATARREFENLFAECAKHDFKILLSYSNRGFVPVTTLLDGMKRHYRNIEIYSEDLKHHSQGRPLADARGDVTEHVFVGHMG